MKNKLSLLMRATRACQEHRTVHHVVCAVQNLVGQKQAYPEGAGMSASANRERAKTGVIGTGVSKGGTYLCLVLKLSFGHDF